MTRGARSRRRDHSRLDWPGQVSRHTELRWPGFVYIGTVIFIALGAFNSQNSLLFVAFGLGVVGVILSGIISGAALTGVSVVRESPGRYRVGEDNPLHYRVFNRNGFVPACALTIEEVIEDDAPRIRVWPGVVVHCAPGQSIRAGAVLRGVRRGRIPLRTIRVRSSFPFGLMVKSVLFEQRDELLIRPARLTLRPIRARAAGRGVAARIQRHDRVGAGLELFGIRDYVPGDSPRMIAWKRSAASEQPLVREMTNPSPPRVWIDLAPPPAGTAPHQLERAAALALSIGAGKLASGHAVGLSAPWAGVQVLPQGGEAQAERLDQTLARLDFSAADHPIARRATRSNRDDRATIGFGVDPAASGVTRYDATNPRVWLDGGSPLPPELEEPLPPPPRKLLPRLRLFGSGEQQGAHA